MENIPACTWRPYHLEQQPSVVSMEMQRLMNYERKNSKSRSDPFSMTATIRLKIIKTKTSLKHFC